MLAMNLAYQIIKNLFYLICYQQYQQFTHAKNAHTITCTVTCTVTTLYDIYM